MVELVEGVVVGHIGGETHGEGGVEVRREVSRGRNDVGAAGLSGSP